MSPRLETDLFVAHVEALVDADALSVREPRLEPLPAVAAGRGDVGVSEALTSTDTQCMTAHITAHYGQCRTGNITLIRIASAAQNMPKQTAGAFVPLFLKHGSCKHKQLESIQTSSRYVKVTCFKTIRTGGRRGATMHLPFIMCIYTIQYSIYKELRNLQLAGCENVCWRLMHQVKKFLLMFLME